MAVTAGAFLVCLAAGDGGVLAGSWAARQPEMIHMHTRILILDYSLLSTTPQRVPYFSLSQYHLGPNGLGLITLRMPSATVPPGDVSPGWQAFMPPLRSPPGTAGAVATSGATGAGLPAAAGPDEGGGVRSSISSTFFVIVWPSHSSTSSALFTATSLNAPTLSPGW